jgi:peptidoglycan-N-acetylglucosamine deacetylase
MRAILGRGRRPVRERTTWPDGSRAALSLSFDDARASQVTQGLALLQRLDAPATFFVLPHAVRRKVRSWRAIAERGHEIGNHSVRHPCSKSLQFPRKQPLEDLTVADIEADLEAANRQLEGLLGITPRVFAYPCGQTFVGRGVETQSYVPVVARKFLVGRTFNDIWANAPLHCDLAQLAAINSDGKSFEQLRPQLDSGLVEGSWIVLGGHEIGDSGGQTTFPATLEAVVRWCRNEGVRIGTIGAIGSTVAAMQPRGADQSSARSMLSAPSTDR